MLTHNGTGEVQLEVENTAQIPGNMVDLKFPSKWIQLDKLQSAFHPEDDGWYRSPN